MMYLITFDRDVYTSPVSVGEFLVQREDGEAADELVTAPLELPVEAENILQPALRNGFKHPEGLLVDASLVDMMAEPHRLEQASAAQLSLEAQLEELEDGPVSVADASHVHQRDLIARDARLDHQDALAHAQTARKDLLSRPIDEGLQQHWDTRGGNRRA